MGPFSQDRAMSKRVRFGSAAQPVDLYSVRPATQLTPTGFGPWDLALGGVTPGIARILGPRSLDYALCAVAADMQSANDCLIVGIAKPPHVTSSLAKRAGLVDPKLLVSNDIDALVHSVRAGGWRYAIIDHADLIPMTFADAQELDQVCREAGCVLFACAGFDSSHAGRVQNSPWSYAVQTVRLVPEVPSHANGVFEVRVIDNPLATGVASESVVRVAISGTGRIGLAESSEGGEGALLLEII